MILLPHDDDTFTSDSSPSSSSLISESRYLSTLVPYLLTYPLPHYSTLHLPVPYFTSIHILPPLLLPLLLPILEYSHTPIQILDYSSSSIIYHTSNRVIEYRIETSSQQPPPHFASTLAFVLTVLSSVTLRFLPLRSDTFIRSKPENLLNENG